MFDATGAFVATVNFFQLLHPLHHGRITRLCISNRPDSWRGCYEFVSEVPWISDTDAAPQFGMTPGAIMNLISRDKFPVPTYKLGKQRVIDRTVLQAFFEAKKTEGLSRLAKSIAG